MASLIWFSGKLLFILQNFAPESSPLRRTPFILALCEAECVLFDPSGYWSAACQVTLSLTLKRQLVESFFPKSSYSFMKRIPEGLRT